MSSLAFNNYMKIDIEIFLVTVSSMSTEGLKKVLEKPFIHLMHGMWTGKYGNNYLGISYAFLHRIQMFKVFLGLN